MSKIGRAQIKQRIYNLRLYKFRAGRLLDPANWSDTYYRALQNLAYDHNVTALEAARIVHDFVVQERDKEIEMLECKLGERLSMVDNFKNVELLPTQNARPNAVYGRSMKQNNEDCRGKVRPIKF